MMPHWSNHRLDFHFVPRDDDDDEWERPDVYMVEAHMHQGLAVSKEGMLKNLHQIWLVAYPEPCHQTTSSPKLTT
jgi:hypothetical protein